MARLRWLIVDESSGKVLDREKIENCEECPNADHKRMVCRKQGGSFLRANYAFPSYCPLGIQGEAGGQD